MVVPMQAVESVGTWSALSVGIMLAGVLIGSLPKKARLPIIAAIVAVLVVSGFVFASDLDIVLDNGCDPTWWWLWFFYC